MEPRCFTLPPIVFAAPLCLLLSGCASTSNLTSSPATPAVKPSLWAGAWGAAMDNALPSPDNAGGQDETFRFLVTPTLSGTQERIRLSNHFGTTPVTIGAARLAVGSDGSPTIDPTHDAPLTFSGQTSVTLVPGATAVSDPVHVTFTFGQTLAVSLNLKGSFAPLPHHNSLFITNYRSGQGSGDQTANSSGTSFTATLPNWLLLSGVDVYGQYDGTLALFGSSTTDGFHSNYSSDQLYPAPNVPVPGQHTSRLSDQLARRLNAAGYQIGIVNEGVSGDSVTPDITNTLNGVQNANDRIARDVLTLPGLLAVVTYFGSIDIRSPDCKSAPAIIASTQQLIATAAAAHLPVVLATIPPSAFCTNPAQPNFGPAPGPSTPWAGGSNPGPANGGETQRLAFNAWIRSTAAQLPGVLAIADFDHALADPARPDFLLAPYNSGDNYHPTGAGYNAEAAVIPIDLLHTLTIH